MAAPQKAVSDFEQVKKIIVYFADFEQVKKIIVYFAGFEQVKNNCSFC